MKLLIEGFGYVWVVLGLRLWNRARVVVMYKG